MRAPDSGHRWGIWPAAHTGTVRVVATTERVWSDVSHHVMSCVSSARTVNWHVRAILGKFGVTSRRELIARAQAAGVAESVLEA